MGGTLLAIYPALARCPRQGDSERVRRRRVQFLCNSGRAGMDSPHPHLVGVHFSTGIRDALHQCLGTQTVDRGREIELPNHSTPASDDRWTLLFSLEPNDVDWVWTGGRTRYTQRTSFSVSNYPRSGWSALRSPSLFHKQAVECDRLDAGRRFSVCGWTWVLNPTRSLVRLLVLLPILESGADSRKTSSACTPSQNFPISNNRPPVRIWGYF